jgi:hypothetical protein
MYSLNIVTSYVLQNTRPLIIGKSDHDRPNKPASLAQSIDSYVKYYVKHVYLSTFISSI